MIALDTNAIIRMLIEDDKIQADRVKRAIRKAQKNSEQILILTEVLIETVWVLESVYKCLKSEIIDYLEMLNSIPLFLIPENLPMRGIFAQYLKGADFADLVVVYQAKNKKARNILSFDKKLQKRFPGFVVEKI